MHWLKGNVLLESSCRESHRGLPDYNGVRIAPILEQRRVCNQMMSTQQSDSIALHPINEDNWRDVAKLEVAEGQRDFVAEPCYYLALCCYGSDWQPLAVYLDEQVIGFLMWAVEEADGSCWLGGILIDQQHQRRGHGGRAVRAAVALLAEAHGFRNFALSYNPANGVAQRLYRKLGFVETGEREDDEVVARLSRGGQQSTAATPPAPASSAP